MKTSNKIQPEIPRGFLSFLTNEFCCRVTRKDLAYIQIRSLTKNRIILEDVDYKLGNCYVTLSKVALDYSGTWTIEQIGEILLAYGAKRAKRERRIRTYSYYA